MKNQGRMLYFLFAALLILSLLAFSGCQKDAGSKNAAHTFTFVVREPDGKETSREIQTDKETVGEALLEQKLIEGEEGDYGLYVTTVNGISLDYNTDGIYWAFYIDGEYAQTGVDATNIVDGSTYSFQAE